MAFTSTVGLRYFPARMGAFVMSRPRPSALAAGNARRQISALFLKMSESAAETLVWRQGYYEPLGGKMYQNRRTVTETR